MSPPPPPSPQPPSPPPPPAPAAATPTTPTQAPTQTPTPTPPAPTPSDINTLAATRKRARARVKQQEHAKWAHEYATVRARLDSVDGLDCPPWTPAAAMASAGPTPTSAAIVRLEPARDPDPHVQEWLHNNNVYTLYALVSTAEKDIRESRSLNGRCNSTSRRRGMRAREGLRAQERKIAAETSR